MPATLRSSILVIEDQEEIQLSAKFLLRKNFETVDVFGHPELAASSLKQTDYDVILLDMNFSRGKINGDEGMFWLKKILIIKPNAVVVLMTAYADVELAIRSIKNGAFDFIIKPWDNMKFVATLQEAYKYSIARKNSITDHKASELQLIGSSVVMKEVIRMAEKVAMTEANVLLLGENGTGKDLLAEHIHNHSFRKNREMVKVDLGSLSESIFESELFGYKKGAFTDAKEDKIGWFEKANDSTLFLDEIANISSPLQSKLLSAIQDGKISRVGSSKQTDVNLRLICATNSNLQEMVAKSTFRKDLLYRINTVEIYLPPLRDRGRDVIDLAKYFLQLYAGKYKRIHLSFSEEAERSILNYKWPGNVRELKHSVERAIILCDGNMIQPEDLIVAESGGTSAADEHLMNLEEIEVNTIRKALTKHGGVISHAANELGLTRASLYRRLEKYGL